MEISELEEFVALLESETPTTHSDFVRLRTDALNCLRWLRDAYDDYIKANGRSGDMEIRMFHASERVRPLYDRANDGIKQWVPKPQLCLNPFGEALVNLYAIQNDE